jgi:hypothetical protein
MAQSFFQTMHSRKLQLQDLSVVWFSISCFVFFLLIYWLMFIPATVYEFSQDISVQSGTKMIHKMLPGKWHGVLKNYKMKQRIVLANFKNDPFLRIRSGQYAWIRMIDMKGKGSYFIPSVVTQIRRPEKQNEDIQVTLHGVYFSAYNDPFENTEGGEVMIEIGKKTPFELFFCH